LRFISSILDVEAMQKPMGKGSGNEGGNADEDQA